MTTLKKLIPAVVAVHRLWFGLAPARMDDERPLYSNIRTK